MPTENSAGRFRVWISAHPLRTLRVGSVAWRYRVAGEGPTGLLALPGAAGGGEAYLPLALELASNLRTVMIHYPVVAGLEEMIEGLAAILDREGIERTALLGGSFGGMVAQAFLLHHPERVSGAVLSATAAPRYERAAQNERWLRRMRWVPMPLFRGLLRVVVRRLMRPVKEDREFWLRFYLDSIDGFDRARLESQYRVSIDFDQRGPDLLAGLADWPGQILVVAGSQDTMITGKVREELLAAYPRARLELIEGAGHGVSLERPREWRAAVGGFLRGLEQGG